MNELSCAHGFSTLNHIDVAIAIAIAEHTARNHRNKSKIERTGVELDQIGGMFFIWNIIKMSRIIKFAVICGSLYKLKD